MSNHDFAVQVLQWLLIACAIGGVALVCEWLASSRKRRRHRHYRMPFDYADDRRHAARRNASIR